MSLLDAASPPGGLARAPRFTAAPARPAARLRAWTRAEVAGAVFALLVFAAAAASAWIATGAVVPWDSKNHFYPMFRFLGDSLAKGELPLWNPYHFGGHPSIADPQSLIFTPTLLAFAWLAPHASMQTFDLVILGHLFVGGLGMLGLAWRRGWRPAAAVLTAIIFMLGGSAAARLQHTGMIVSYSFFPLAFWALESAMERPRIRAGVLFGALASLMALGRDQVAFLFCAMFISLVVWNAIRSGAPFVWLRHRLTTLIAAGVTGVAILAVPALLTMQFLGASNRPDIAYGVAAAGSLAPVNLITLLAPNFFGSLSWAYDYWGPGYETVAEPDWTDRAVNYLFIGTAPIVLLLWQGVVGGRLIARGSRLFVAILAVTLVYALGRYTPVFERVFDLVPGVSLYRRPADATFAVNIALALICGHQLHLYLEHGLARPALHLGRRRAHVAAGLAAIGLALLVGVGLAFSWKTGHLLVSAIELGGAIVLAGFGVAVMVVFRHRRHRAVAAALLVAATMGELVWRNAAASLNAEPAARYTAYDHKTRAEAAGLALLSREIEAATVGGQRPRVEILGLGGAWQNASMVYGLENTLGYNPLRIADYERAVGPGENAGDPNLRQFPGTFRGYKCKLASLLGLEYVVLDRPAEKLPRHFPRLQQTPVFVGDKLYIYKLDQPAPRAYFASGVRPIESEAALEDKALPDFDRNREALIDQTSIADLSAEMQAQATSAVVANVSITEYRNNSVTLDVVSDKPGVVVLHDLFYPGWRVRVDGVGKPVLRANLLFRGVEVPAGRHRVEFTFEPLRLANLAHAVSRLLHRDEE